MKVHRFKLSGGEAITRDQCRIWLLNAAEKFFLCGDAPVEHLSRALMMVGEPK